MEIEEEQIETEEEEAPEPSPAPISKDDDFYRESVEVVFSNGTSISLKSCTLPVNELAPLALWTREHVLKNSEESKNMLRRMTG